MAPVFHVTIALIAAWAMAVIACSTFVAKIGSLDVRTPLIVFHTILAHTALNAKVCNFAIACVTAGAMGLPFIYSAIKANALPVEGAASHVDFYTIGAHTALLAPFAHIKIALVTTGTVGTFFNSTLQTHIVADFLGGAAVADFRA